MKQRWMAHAVIYRGNVLGGAVVEYDTVSRTVSDIFIPRAEVHSTRFYNGYIAVVSEETDFPDGQQFDSLTTLVSAIKKMTPAVESDAGVKLLFLPSDVVR